MTRLILRATNAKQRDRYRAVELAIAGYPSKEVMARLGRSRGFVQRWCYAYRAHGLGAVRPASPPGRPTTLPAELHAAFKQRILDGPTRADDVCTLRGEDARRILKDEFGVSYELSGVYQLMHRPRKPNLTKRLPRRHFREHRKSDPQAQQQWVKDAPFLSAKSGNDTPTGRSPFGSKAKQESASRGR